ncbi:2-dehydropantoate 2-reductase [Thalassobaculum sp.]|uniref:ketopantoate reductase family protein n=1 Tax=Thalassobaculum sp. TaxID=2022740 RepID=UPI0032EC12E1
MRIGIVGAGAVGGFLAGHLARAGTEVALLARGPHLAALRERGLTVESQGQRWTVRVLASDRAGDLGEMDAVVVTAKAPALPAIAAAIAPMLGPDTPVICAMNGIPWWYDHGRAGAAADRTIARLDPDGAIWRGIGPQRAIGCVVDCPAQVVEPGLVRHVAPRPGALTLGEPEGGTSERMTRLAAAIEASGVKAPMVDDIRAALWSKLFVNISRSPLGVLTGATERELAADPGTLSVTLAIMREAQAVARAHGIEVAIDVDRQSDPQNRSEHRSSMLQDWDLGRPMEIDGIVRVVQDFARAADVPTPTLDVVATLLEAKARGAGTYEG